MSICRGFAGVVGLRRQKFDSVTRRTVKVPGTSRLRSAEIGAALETAPDIAFRRNDLVGGAAVLDFGNERRYSIVK